METKEIKWINYVRAICMFIIYASHCVSYYGFSIPYVFSVTDPIYVNAFFFVSGYLFFRKQLSEPVILEDRKTYIHNAGGKFLQNIFFRLFVPSLIFSIIEYIPSCLLRGGTVSIGDTLKKTLGGGTYWFTSALIIAELILFVLMLTRIKNIWFYFVCSVGFYALSLVLFCADFEQIPNYWGYKNGFMSMIFIALGGVYWKYEDAIHKVTKNKIVLCILTVLYTGLLLLFDDSFKVLIVLNELNPLGILISTVGIIVLIEICKMLKKCNWLNDIGKNTIGLYFMCGAWPIVMGMIVRKIMGINLAGWVIVYVLSFCFAYITMKLIVRFIPFMFDLRNGKNLFRKAEKES